MKKSWIKVGGNYVAKVSGKLTTVRVDAISEGTDSFGRQSKMRYDCTNLATGRKVTFRSSQKFREEAADALP